MRVHVTGQIRVEHGLAEALLPPLGAGDQIRRELVVSGNAEPVRVTADAVAVGAGVHVEAMYSTVGAQVDPRKFGSGGSRLLLGAGAA
jgi:hypothetical protein